MKQMASPSSPTTLTIAGSDPTGGAGIQADLKTMTAIGVYGAAAITCITVQNSRGVSESVPLDPGLVVRQVRAVLADHHVTHIKIGMIGAMEIAMALGELLAEFSGEVIYDPVLASTTGQSLLSCENLTELHNRLISRVTVLTPNGDELARLCRREIATADDAIQCAIALLARHEHLRAVIVKGGHLEPDSAEIRDYLILQNQEIIACKRTRVNSANLHGTGCTYASAFAAHHCLEHDDIRAFFRTATFMDDLITLSRNRFFINNDGNGPLFHAGLRLLSDEDNRAHSRGTIQCLPPADRLHPRRICMEHTMIENRIRGLLQSQLLGVLATSQNTAPHACLVAFVVTEDLQRLVFLTSRATRKFSNLVANSNVSMLIDNRSNQAVDFHNAIAVTVIGKAIEQSGSTKDELLALFLARHPDLEPFSREPSTALIEIRVKVYQLVGEFQQVSRLDMSALPGDQKQN